MSPEPFLRGNRWPGTDDLPYPRADPADLTRLPGDTVGTARLPVGVRLEFVGDRRGGRARLPDRDRRPRLPRRGGGHHVHARHRRRDGVGAGAPRFRIGAVRAPRLAGGTPTSRIVVYLPEGMRPRCPRGRVRKRPARAGAAGPRWIAYGDSIAEGWIASGPSGAWPAVAARRHGLDVVNLGYAGSARGELPSAQQIAALDADVISISHGTNCWSRIPFSTALFAAQTRAFIAFVREGHPDTPIVVTSPILRPDAETTANALGATLVDLRVAMEDLTRELIAAGDEHLTLVEGGDLIGADDLPDGIHPGDHGHAVLADAFGGAVAAACAYTGPSLEG